jgi:hypothetical protein
MRQRTQPRPLTHQPARPRLLLSLPPVPSYRQFVQEPLAGIMKVGDHAERFRRFRIRRPAPQLAIEFAPRRGE